MRPGILDLADSFLLALSTGFNEAGAHAPRNTDEVE